MNAEADASRDAAVLGVLYALLVLVALFARAEPFAAGPVPAGRLVEFVAPGALDPGPSGANLLAPLLLDVPSEGPGATVDATSLRDAASRATDATTTRTQPSPAGRLFVGILPLLLALLGLVWSGGRTAHVLRVALVVAGTLAATDILGSAWVPLAVPVLLAPVAGLGLASLLRRDDDRRGAGAPLAVAAVSVLLAGVLGAGAAAAGARSEQDLVAPITRRLLARGFARPTTGQVHHTATHLLEQLDTSALAAMLAMLALLLLLKTRRLPVVLLVMLVSLADLFREPLATLLRGAS